MYSKSPIPVGEVWFGNMFRFDQGRHAGQNEDAIDDRILKLYGRPITIKEVAFAVAGLMTIEDVKYPYGRGGHMILELIVDILNMMSREEWPEIQKKFKLKD